MADAKLIAEIVTEKFSGEDLQQYIAMLIANVSFGVMQDAKKQVVDVRVKVGPVSLSRGSEER